MEDRYYSVSEFIDECRREEAEMTASFDEEEFLKQNPSARIKRRDLRPILTLEQQEHRLLLGLTEVEYSHYLEAQIEIGKSTRRENLKKRFDIDD